MGVRAAIAAAILALAPIAAPAQEAGAPPSGQVRSPVLTIDPDRLLDETRFGRRMQADLRVRSDALVAENERLRAELTAEEGRLTELRPTMEVEDFRAEAEAFDARVQRIRNEQDAKQRALEQAVEASRDTFLNAVTPVLAGLMIDSGAGVILEQRQVFLSASLIDITDEAIAAIDAELGDGTAQENPETTDPAGADAPNSPGDSGAPTASDSSDIPGDSAGDPALGDSQPAAAEADGG